MAAADDVLVSCGPCDAAPEAGASLRCRVAADAAGGDAAAVDAEARVGAGGDVQCRVPKAFVRAGAVCIVTDAAGRRVGSGECKVLSAAAAEGVEPAPKLPWLDRLLPAWILLAMTVGVLLGYFVPGIGESLAIAHIGDVSLPIALGLWIMMWPVLTKVRYELLHELLLHPSVLGHFSISFLLNWVLGPALMTGLAWACLPDLPGFRAGVIMVGLARCIAMVLIWNQLAGGNAEMCAVMVAFNSVLQIILYAPLSIFYLRIVSGGAAVNVGFWPVAKSVLLFLGVPLVAGVLLRIALVFTAGRRWFEDKFMPWFGPWALIGLLYTIIIMFASQGKEIINQLGNVARVSVPMLVYFLAMFALSLVIAWYSRMTYAYAATQAFTASSNNFELAIAVAIGTFGLRSSEALAATVGPLIEVPVLMALVYVALWVERRWWGARDEELAAAGAARAAAKAAKAAGPANTV